MNECDGRKGGAMERYLGPLIAGAAGAAVFLLLELLFG